MAGLDSYYTVLARVVTFVAVSELSWLDVAVYYTSTAVAGLDSYYTVLAQVVTFVAVSEPSWRPVVAVAETWVAVAGPWIAVVAWP